MYSKACYRKAGREAKAFSLRTLTDFSKSFTDQEIFSRTESRSTESH